MASTGPGSGVPLVRSRPQTPSSVGGVASSLVSAPPAPVGAVAAANPNLPSALHPLKSEPASVASSSSSSALLSISPASSSTSSSLSSAMQPAAIQHQPAPAPGPALTPGLSPGSAPGPGPLPPNLFNTCHSHAPLISNTTTTNSPRSCTCSYFFLVVISVMPSGAD